MESVFSYGGMIGAALNFNSTDSFAPTSITYVTNTKTSDGNSITLPSEAMPGDIAIICDNVNTGDPSNPSGWTLIRAGSVASSLGVATYYRILTISDMNTTVYSTDTSTTDHFMLCVIFRANNAPPSALVGDVDGVCTTSNPDSQTLNCTAGTTPLIGCYAYMQRGVDNNSVGISTAPTTNFVGVTDGSSYVKIRLYYQIYNVGDTLANLSGDMSDNGTQAFQSWYMSFPYSPTDNKRNSGVWSMAELYRAKLKI